MDNFKFLLNGKEIAKKYQASKNPTEKKKLVMNIFTGIYFNLNRLVFINQTEDFKSDFTIFFYNKISNILEKYDPEKSNFITFLTINIKYALKSFICINNKKKHIQDITILEEILNLSSKIEEKKSEGKYNFYASEKNITYSKNISKAKNIKKNIYFSLSKENRLILILACKASLFLDDNQITKIANKINISIHELYSLIHKLRKNSNNRQENINKIINKRNSHYIKMKASKQFIEASIDDKTNIYLKAKKSYEFNYKSWLRSKNINRHQLKTPSDKMIGDCLNISRQTVSSNIDKAIKKLYK